MPEGHIIHLLAAEYGRRFTGGVVAASSPQGKFSDSAALLDGQRMAVTDAHGKHLFLGFEGFDGQGWVRVHLGLYGKVAFGLAPAPAPVGAVRLRLESERDYADLRGPTACELITAGEKQAVHDRLGPDPLRPHDDPERAWSRIIRSRGPIAALLMDQKIIAGVGNVYRAEVLFRHGIDPYRPGRELSRAEWDAIWADLVALMREGAASGRIDTVRPEHTPEAMRRPPRVDDHGGEVYVYRRAGQHCHICGSEIRTADLEARNLFWCPACQQR
ncbi:Fpg/Nei family DNA glycosylase [Microtetraspora malaysiensis]|uniref:Fpg/Nei family DNA glycosylase n=1 Tax=Microtetraspora malaysiensis TaxID=161358 RepID=UPI003D8DB45C